MTEYLRDNKPQDCLGKQLEDTSSQLDSISLKRQEANSMPITPLTEVTDHQMMTEASFKKAKMPSQKLFKESSPEEPDGEV